jgi:hypothetical protein
MTEAKWSMTCPCYVDLVLKDAEGKEHWLRRTTEAFTFIEDDLEDHVMKIPAEISRWIDEQLAQFPGYQEAIAILHWNQFECPSSLREPSFLHFFLASITNYNIVDAATHEYRAASRWC